jgi:hypothetical protein
LCSGLCRTPLRMITTPVFIGMLVIGGLLFSRQRYWPKLKDRPCRSSKEFYRDFYQSSGLPEAFVVGMYDFIESNFGIASRLQPNDSFSEIENVGAFDFDSDTSFLLEAAFRHLTKHKPDDEARIREIEDQLSRVTTVDELIRLFALYEL